MAAINHSNRAHAFLSASGASKWINCTPSARLEEPYRNTGSSDYAAEGTLAHEFADIELRFFNGEINEKQYQARLAAQRKHKLYTDEMEGFVADYVNYVKDVVSASRANDPFTLLSVEERLSFTDYVPKSFGTGDAVVVADENIDIIDLKYGKGVAVSAIENSQLMLYGLGAYMAYKDLYDIEFVTVHIGQPRMYSFSEYTITVEELLNWADEISVRAQLAIKGEGEQVAGSWCRWCKAKAICRAYSGQKYQEAVEDFSMAEPELLSDEELMQIYGKISDLKSWIKAVDEFVKSGARKGTIKHPGYKLVRGTAKRSWTDPDEVIAQLETMGFSEIDTTNSKIKGILAIEQLVSKDTFINKLSHLVNKPQGAPTLVPDTDKRPAIGGTQSALEDFA